jgi:hypothetical protein
MPIPLDIESLIRSQLPGKLAAATPADEPMPPMNAGAWMQSAPPVPSFGLPSGLGELTEALSSEDLADELVAPEATFASMAVVDPPQAAARRREAANRTGFCASGQSVPVAAEIRRAHPGPQRQAGAELLISGISPNRRSPDAAARSAA